MVRGFEPPFIVGLPDGNCGYMNKVHMQTIAFRGDYLVGGMVESGGFARRAETVLSYEAFRLSARKMNGVSKNDNGLSREY